MQALRHVRKVAGRGAASAALRRALALPEQRAFSVLQGIAAAKTPQMLCFQCEQTSAGKGCTTVGICSKTPELAGLQDLQMAYNLHLTQLGHALKSGPLVQECRKLVLESTFATLTNVNFDDGRFEAYLKRAATLVEKMSAELDNPPPAPSCLPKSLPETRKDMFLAASQTGLVARSNNVGDEDLFGVVEMGTYGLKGLVAYFYHAEALAADCPGAYSEEEREEVYQELFRLGAALARAGNEKSGEAWDLNAALGECLALGGLNLKVMKLLDAAHNAKFGTPGPIEVSTSPEMGRHAILVSGHDLHHLEALLKQSENKGIDVYTHGEMLPAHGYPGLNKYKHLKGHFGTHWGNQLAEFRCFPGPIVMTSNCLRPPTRKYSDRLFTAGPVGFKNIPQIQDNDFSAVITKALTCPVMEQSAMKWAKDGVPRNMTTGFGHAAILGVADKVVEAIKAGALKHVFVIGGCDGTEGKRSYFTDLALDTPEDSIILTLGCGKFRLNGDDHGTLGGLPRLLDVGQCNDAYGAIVVAVKLAEALGCKVHDLPLHFAVSWFEQKAVAVLLTLLHLELKNIRLGPAVPAFLTPRVIGILNEKFGLMGIDVEHEDDDLEKMLQGK
mmetsp:Transcript_44689/g.96076  ORF Transcript_44689/g.96076 Transcript_44689/m.96076 type:complete len:613 (-) Transcript_44689:37-1875(-)